MPLIKRRPKPSPAPPPDVYVSYGASSTHQVWIRFFFVDELYPRATAGQTEEGNTLTACNSPHPGVQELQEEIQASTGARIIPHRQYIELQWTASNYQEIAHFEAPVIELLAKHFSWKDPLVDYFDCPSLKKYEVERRRGVRWSLVN